MKRITLLWVVFLLAWRNLFSHVGKNLIVGSIIVFGTFLVVLGTSLLDSIERSMTRSVTASIAGHFQVYDKTARDDLTLYGGGMMGAPDIGSIPDFSRVKDVLLKLPNIQAVVPMGTDSSEFYANTELDRAIESLRRAISEKDSRAIDARVSRIQLMAELMLEEFTNRLQIMSTTDEIKQQIADIKTALSPEFWQRMESDPQSVVSFLDTKLAPLVDEGEGLFLTYLGTDLHLFAKNFSTFEIVSGQMVPQGRRGLLINQGFYDDYVRNKVAREFDGLHKKIHQERRTIAGDPMLQNQVKRMVRQYRRITFQLEPEQTETLTKKLQQLMPEEEGNIDQLVQAFLRVDDDNFTQRHKYFFAEIAPLIRLYLFDVGEVITIQAYTKSGYTKAINVKVYGTFSFKGLEKSALAGSHNLMDIVTFRDLYGMMTEEKRRELKTIQTEVGVADVSAADAEAALFGAGETVEVQQQQKEDGFDEFADVDLRQQRLNGKALHDSSYDQASIDNGMALHAAIVLKDPTKMEQTGTQIEQVSAQHGLGLQVVDWQTASGIVGQMVVLVRVILYVAILIIFLVALVIINNTMVLATVERTVEIGTMRAIGGQSRFVLVLFLLETVLLGLVAGLVGAGGGAALIGLLGSAGIPAFSDEMVFLFSGPKLFPEVAAGNLIIAALVIFGVSLIATFYPAFIATRITPAVAMQARE